ncbi:MAG TPA: ribonuclease [Allosphingosinicella sp.]|nr:ribonuclease [Allosphingosinicella sp.]
MAEWLYEEGIGENRAILVEDGEILEAAIELPGELRCGSIVPGWLTDITIPGRRGFVTTAAGPVLIEPLPPGLTQGQKVRVEIAREAIAEPGNPKLAKGRITGEAEREGPALAERTGAAPLRQLAPDRFEEAGWSELIEEAVSGDIGFRGGHLRMSLTPAMTLLDVDGSLPPMELAVAGAAAAGRAIRRLGIGGSIGIDLPTLPPRGERQRAAAALDSTLPQPFERTAVNGFGFLQVIRRRERPSLPELLQWDSAGSAARALLRRAERYPGVGRRELVAAPAVIARLRENPAWLETLARRIGAPVALREEPGFTTWAGHVHARPS